MLVLPGQQAHFHCLRSTFLGYLTWEKVQQSHSASASHWCTQKSSEQTSAMGCNSSKDTGVVDASQKPGEPSKVDSDAQEHSTDVGHGATQSISENDHGDNKKS